MLSYPVNCIYEVTSEEVSTWLLESAVNQQVKPTPLSQRLSSRIGEEAWDKVQQSKLYHKRMQYRYQNILYEPG